ncbi:hypothetical protein DL765_000716 [Monosporascus sp. GIB2]|nr:hypothetical protein DL765_000716 [Monosporascus sp. GIB2]
MIRQTSLPTDAATPKQSCLSSAFGFTTASASSSGHGKKANGARTTAPPPPFWPAQQAYCDDADTAGAAGSCVRSACAATPAVFTSYSSLSSSLCSRYASCTSAGRGTGGPGLVAVTHPAGATVTWGAAPGWFESAAPGWGGGGGGPTPIAGRGEGSKFFGPGPRFAGGEARGEGEVPPGGWHGNGGDRGEDYSEHSSSWTSAHDTSSTPGPETETGPWTRTETPRPGEPPPTWGGGAVGTVEACALFDGSPWYAGPRCGWNARGGFDGWVGWGAGWSWGPTSTQIVTMTMTVTTAAAAAGIETTTTQTQAAVATVALAISGDYTTSTTIGVARVTDDSSSDGAGRPASKMLGVWLGLLVAVVAFL